MALRSTRVVSHARYLMWASKAVAAANREWRSRRPYRGDVIMTRDGLHHWLYRWAIGEGLMVDPGTQRRQGDSAFVAAVFEKSPRAVKEEARRYWRMLVGHQEAQQGEEQQ